MPEEAVKPGEKVDLKNYQVFEEVKENTRGNKEHRAFYKVLYKNEVVVMLQTQRDVSSDDDYDDNYAAKHEVDDDPHGMGHTLESREAFESKIESGRVRLVEDSY